ncbi:TPA: aminopeptidase [Candidatus Saccharibacteria bacterium]|nr:aminopeptidase [Candidatus Saccharibacteria bacterium]HRK41182.1 M1 family metallopeptidase [Candidatus Saccharibacteria bacterium]
MQTVPRLYEQFQPTNYRLSLDLTKRKARTFSGVVEIDGAYSGGPLRLHAKDLEISNAKSNGSDVMFSLERDHLTLDDTGEAGERNLIITFSGKITDGMHGLYPCYFDVDGQKKELLATQFESHHAREVFPCIDEPEAKAVFDLTLQTESDVTVLSNMPSTSTKNVEAGAVHVFDTTPRMSTYLLAFVVGELQKQSARTNNGVEVNVWATNAQPAASLAFPLEVAVKCIEFFDEYFGTAYPLPKADHVALPDFSSGAMENWGLITYREVALLVDASSSVSMREYVATVIAHETSHQWFGNLVTMKWWDDLWLNESFATIMEYVAVDALYPEWHAWNTFASQETLSALRRDQLAGVQSVKVEVNHPDEISTIFDPSIVYAKGGRLLKMLRSYIGEEAFRAGLRAYFKEHAYGNTIGSDLWRAFSASSSKDIEGFMSAWLTQPGLPLVDIKTTDDGYALSQQRLVIGEEPGDARWPIPLFATNSAFPELFEESSTTVTAEHTLPLLNRENDAHFVSKYDEPAWQLLHAALQAGEVGDVPRLALLHETSLLARSGDSKTAALVPLLGVYDQEDKEPVWNIISMVIGDLKRFVEENETSELALKQLVTRLATPQFERLGFEPSDTETEQDTKLRATIIGLLAYADHPAIVKWALDVYRQATDLALLAPETRAITFAMAAKHGDEDDFARLVETHSSTVNAELRDDVASGVCAARDETRISRLLARLTDDSLVRRQDVFRWYIYLLRNRHARDATWAWMTGNWNWIVTSFKGDKSYDDFARYSANVFGTYEWLETYRAFFEPKKSETALKRAIEIGLVEIAGRAEWIERDRSAVTAALAQETA